VYRPGNGVESPRLLRSVRPNYTAEAMRAKMQGVVRLEGVVLPDGTVGDLKITRSLDAVFGLDQEAIKAAKQFRFVPGTRFGEPVAVLVSFEIEFTLR
jgi:protein TonB